MSHCFRFLSLKASWLRRRRISYCSRRGSPSLLQGLRGKHRRRLKSLTLSLMILCQNNIQRLPGMQLLAVNCFKITIITVNNNKFTSLYEYVIVIVSLFGFVSVGVDCMLHHKSPFDAVFCVFVQCVYIFVLVFFSGYTAHVLYYCECGELDLMGLKPSP